jgi:hypothetical protein
MRILVVSYHWQGFAERSIDAASCLALFSAVLFNFIKIFLKVIAIAATTFTRNARQRYSF